MSIKDIAAKGRYGDNHLLHVSDAELQGLNALANKTFGHGLTQNPETGLPEAFLFAPLLAPMLASSVPALAGMGAVGTGLAAGVLGAGEAAARGMDDPLMHGAMAGLTAGAAQGIGSNLADMGAQTAATEGALAGGTEIANQAIANPMADAAMTGGTGAGLDLTSTAIAEPSVAFNNMATNTGMGAGSSGTISPIASQMTPGSAQIGMEGSFNTMPYGGPQPLPGQTPGVGMAQNAPSPSFDVTADIAPATSPTFMEDPSGYMKNVGTGAKQAFGSQEGFKQFMGDNQMALGAGLTGIAGSGQLEAQQEMREAGEAQEAEKKAKYDEMVARIKQNYADVGRPLPTNPYGPLFGGPQGFKEGKEVKPEYYGDGRYLPDWLREKMGKTDKRAGGGYLEGGIASLKGDGMSDSVPAKIDGSQPAALSTGEYVIPADVVSHLGNGSSDDGAMRLDEMLDRIRMARTGTEEQAPQIKPDKYLPA